MAGVPGHEGAIVGRGVTDGDAERGAPAYTERPGKTSLKGRLLSWTSVMRGRCPKDPRKGRLAEAW